MQLWETAKFERISNDILDKNEEYKALTQEKAEIGLAIDCETLRLAKVVGATTTGAAKYRDLLASKSAEVVIVEEAGEVLESHVLTALTERKEDSNETNHLILIGDHLQLRPKLESYNLTEVSGNGFDLDVSLFERLILSNYQAQTMLGVQHRMRPCIADLIRRLTYPTLKDHESVLKFPSVKGVSNDLLFVHHGHPEDGKDGVSTTKSNSHEATICVEIVRYLLLQGECALCQLAICNCHSLLHHILGYAHHQLTILTPYVGQILAISKEMRKLMKEVNAFISDLDRAELLRGDEDVGDIEVGQQSRDRNKSIRCSSIDNFQGEESDIVVISLVRSNANGSIGFLKEEQRVNVLLSRARVSPTMHMFVSC